MSSQNFAYLKDRWPHLFEQASFSGKYIWSDPSSAVVKLRCYVELLVGVLYKQLNLSSEPKFDLFQRISAKEFREIVDADIIQKLHAIRMLGNKAAHGKSTITPCVAEKLYYDAYLLGKWLYRTYSGSSADYPNYIEPERTFDYEGALKDRDSLKNQLTKTVKELDGFEKAERAAALENLKLHRLLDEKQRELQEYQNIQGRELFKQASMKAATSFDLDIENTKALITLEDAFEAYVLTEGQAELVKKMGAFLASENENVFLLNGYAGTGKTFITQGLTEYFRGVGRNFILAAPTGKAAKVLAKKTQINAYTVHKSIYDIDGLKEYFDGGLDGSQTYKFYAKIKVNTDSSDTVYIIDEASMIANIYQDDEFFKFGSGFLLKDFFKYLNLDHNDHTKKVIFIGDNAQLPPVGMNFSPALDKEYLTTNFSVSCTGFELTEVVRQKKESGIIKNAIVLRDSLQKNIFNKLTIDSNFSDISEVYYSDIIDKYLESCNYKINKESIIIAYSNTDVAIFNKQVREYFFPLQPQIVSGDKVMAMANQDKKGFLIANGDFGLIRRVSSEVEERKVLLKSKNKETGKIDTKEITLTFRDVHVGFNNLQGKACFFDTKIIENLLYSNQVNLTSDENKALYIDFCIRNSISTNSPLFQEALRADPYFNAMRLKFGYAITCHKAQGSEWNHVFVKCKTHQNQLTREYFRWFYTAITRTATHLYLLEPPNIGIGSQIRMSNVMANKSINKSQDDIGENDKKENFCLEERMRTTFFLPEDALFSRELLRRVNALIEGHGIIVQSIDLQQYQDVYFFQKESLISRINIYYNSKKCISRLMEVRPSDIGQKIIMMLASLKGQMILGEEPKSIDELGFMEEYQVEFHKCLINAVEKYNVKILGVESRNWALRYTFSFSGENAVFDIFYNAKKQFTKCVPIGIVGSHLVDMINNILTEGLS